MGIITYQECQVPGILLLTRPIFVIKLAQYLLERAQYIL
jgi:hypothetical protein